jgi:hypothetical protein
VDERGSVCIDTFHEVTENPPLVEDHAHIAYYGWNSQVNASDWEFIYQRPSRNNLAQCYNALSSAWLTNINSYTTTSVPPPSLLLGCVYLASKRRMFIPVPIARIPLLTKLCLTPWSDNPWHWYPKICRVETVGGVQR